MLGHVLVFALASLLLRNNLELMSRLGERVVQLGSHESPMVSCGFSHVEKGDVEGQHACKCKVLSMVRPEVITLCPTYKRSLRKEAEALRAGKNEISH